MFQTTNQLMDFDPSPFLSFVVLSQLEPPRKSHEIHASPRWLKRHERQVLRA